MRKGLFKEQGLTLLEIVIAVLLIGLVGLSFAAVYATAQRFLIQTMGLTSSQAESAFAIEHMRRELVRATNIVAPAVGAAATNQVTFRRPPNTFDSRYQIDGTTLEFVPNTAAATEKEVVARNISNLSITRPNQAQLNIDLTAQQTDASGDILQNRMTTTVVARGIPQP